MNQSQQRPYVFVSLRKHPSGTFRPTEKQLVGMAGCLVGALKRYNGSLRMDSDYRALVRQLLQDRKIHCRGNRFGNSRHEIELTAVAAFRRLERDGTTEYKDGWLKLKRPAGKKHRYANRSQQLAQARRPAYGG